MNGVLSLAEKKDLQKNYLNVQRTNASKHAYAHQLSRNNQRDWEQPTQIKAIKANKEKIPVSVQLTTDQNDHQNDPW